MFHISWCEYVELYATLCIGALMHVAICVITRVCVCSHLCIYAYAFEQVLTEHVISQLTQHVVSVAVSFQEGESLGSVTFTAGMLLIYEPRKSCVCPSNSIYICL